MNNINQNAKNLASTPINSPMISTDLSTTTEANAANSLTGTGLSSPGLAMLRSLTQAQNQMPDANKINNQLLASLKLDLGWRLVTKNRLNADYEAVSTEIKITGSVSDAWMKAIEYYTKPSSGEMVAMEVTRLRTLTAKRKEGEFDLELSIGAITEELRDFPQDIVRTTCREWARNNKFFPVLKELLDECKKFMQLRQAILDQMKNQRFIEHKKKQDDDWQKPTEAETQKVSDIMAEITKASGAP